MPPLLIAVALAKPPELMTCEPALLTKVALATPPLLMTCVPLTMTSPVTVPVTFDVKASAGLFKIVWTSKVASSVESNPETLHFK
jgi:hypothetical protein